METETAEGYPRTNTRAEDVLGYIRANPGTTTNGIITGLGMNPAVVRKCLVALQNRYLITDQPDERQHHHYTAR